MTLLEVAFWLLVVSNISGIAACLYYHRLTRNLFRMIDRQTTMLNLLTRACRTAGVPVTLETADDGDLFLRVSGETWWTGPPPKRRH